MDLLDGFKGGWLALAMIKETDFYMLGDTVDGRNPAPVEVAYPIIFRVFYIPGGCLGFLLPTSLL